MSINQVIWFGIGEPAADYPSASDIASAVWSALDRQLTALDEDVTTIDLNNTAIGSVAGAVGSVTGNVGGNVVGSVGSVTAGVTFADAMIETDGSVWTE